MDPFFFLRRRPREPLTLQTAAFSLENIIVGLGGPEMGCASVVGVDVDREGELMEGWRRDAIGRLAPSGLVDASGVPCPELARALAPLRPPGAFVLDETSLNKERPTKWMSTAVCVDESRTLATALIRPRRRRRPRRSRRTPMLLMFNIV